MYKRPKLSEEWKRMGGTDGEGWDYFGARWDYLHEVYSVLQLMRFMYIGLAEYRVGHSIHNKFVRGQMPL